MELHSYAAIINEPCHILTRTHYIIMIDCSVLYLLSLGKLELITVSS